MRDEFEVHHEDGAGDGAPEERAGGRLLARLALRLRELWERALTLHVLWLVVFLCAGTWCLIPSGTLFVQQVAEGAVAHRDYEAPRDLLVTDEQATREKQQRAREAVLPVYDYDALSGRELDRALADLFAGERVAQADDDRPSPAAGRPEAAPDGLRLSLEQRRVLSGEGYSVQLEEWLRGVAERVLARGVVANKAVLLEHRARGITLRNLETGSEADQLDLYDFLGYPEEVAEAIRSELREATGVSSRQRERLLEFLLGNITPNVHPNRSETLARQEAAAASSEVVFNQVRRGQVIVRKGDPIGAGDARLLAEVRGNRDLAAKLLPVLGSFLMVALAGLVVWLGFRRTRFGDKGRRQIFAEMVLLLLLCVLGARFGFFVADAIAASFDTSPFDSAAAYTYAVPFGSLALVTALLYSRASALLLSLLYALLVGVMAGYAAFPMVVYSLGGSLAAIYTLDRSQFKQRSVLTRAGLAIGLVNVIAVLMIEALAMEPMRAVPETGLSAGCALVGGLLCSATASFALPILESLFGITTDIKLVELANTNLPLLRRLAFEAPGTFQHSLMVANLAKAGCEGIGADAVLAYTGGLYHDVGKVVRPEYFIENQRPGFNPHDELPPLVSASILVSHIRDGVELAREHHLPPPIRQAIEQHHGTHLITYFFNRAAERLEPRAGSGEVSRDEFRYPGPKPQNKVLGVLMIADAVEAASRTLLDPTAERIRSVIDAIVENCVADDQLEETDLTLSDLRKVGDSFHRFLANIYHRRIDYPGFDFNRMEPRLEGAPADDAVRPS